MITKAAFEVMTPANKETVAAKVAAALATVQNEKGNVAAMYDVMRYVCLLAGTNHAAEIIRQKVVEEEIRDVGISSAYQMLRYAATGQYTFSMG